MASVKGSRQEKMVVVPYRPWRQRFFALWISLAVALAAAAGMLLGHSDATRDQAHLLQMNQQLQTDLDSVRDELANVRSRYALLDRSLMVDQRASEEAQSTISHLRTRVAQLEQDVLFYRQVMLPDGADSGLVLAQADVRPTDLPENFHFRVVFRQVGQQDKTLDGKALIRVRGQLDGSPHAFALRELSNVTEEDTIALNFLYFQNVEGELQIPPGFTPEQIEIIASSVKPVAKQIEKTIKWPVAGVQ